MNFHKGAKEVVLPPGEYLIGDPCYHVPDEQWGRVLDESDFFDGQCWATFDRDHGGTGFVVAFGTKYGDGCYSDQSGRSYGVDAGLIGIIPFDDVDTAKVDLSCAHLMKFETHVACWESGGKITFGPVTIDTDDEVDEWDEE